MKFKQWFEAIQVGQEFEIQRPDGKKVPVRVAKIKGDKAWVLPFDRTDINSAIVMPLSSVMHFVNDLSGRVNITKRSGNPFIDAVLDGKGKYLGKGDEGVAFEVGDMVVKVSTTVPYIPENPWHRSPAQAARMLYNEARNSNKMLEEGISGILPCTFKVVGDKSFLIRPKVEVLTKLTPEQLNELRQSILEMHKHGWTLRDQMQVGLLNGHIYHYDTGKAVKEIDKHSAEFDMDNLANVYDISGYNDLFVPVGRILKDKWNQLTSDRNIKISKEKPDGPWAKILWRDLNKYYQAMLDEFPEQKQQTTETFNKVTKEVPKPNNLNFKDEDLFDV